MGNHIGENLSALSKVQEFPTSGGCFQEIATNCLNTLAQLAKKFSCLHENVFIG